MGYLKELEECEIIIKNEENIVANFENNNPTRRIKRGPLKYAKAELKASKKRRKKLVYDHRKKIIDKIKNM